MFNRYIFMGLCETSKAMHFKFMLEFQFEKQLSRLIREKNLYGKFSNEMLSRLSSLRYMISV